MTVIGSPSPTISQSCAHAHAMLLHGAHAASACADEVMLCMHVAAFNPAEKEFLVRRPLLEMVSPMRNQAVAVCSA